jgi:uncharacterized membrane protein YhaH (DUF805 family)
MTSPTPGTQPDLSKPLYGASMGQAVSRFFKKYAHFTGRASRSEFWWLTLAFTVFYVVLAVLAAVVAGATGSMATGSDPSPAVVVIGVLFFISLIGLIVPSISLTVRRLHDADLSGWLILLNLIPYLGGLIVLILNILPSNPRGERFDA